MKIGKGPWRERFWKQVDKTFGFGPAGDCWRWTGCTSPYGKILIDGKRTLAHRASYELHFGPVPPGPGFHGNCVCHDCDTPSCVNPDHLFLGPHKRNVEDRTVKGRSSRGLEHQQRRQGENHGQARLTESDVRAIRADPRLYREIADTFAIGESHVCNLKAGRGWRHIMEQ